jgi:hypothetical protein
MDCTNLQPRLRHVDVGNPPSRTTKLDVSAQVSWLAGRITETKDGNLRCVVNSLGSVDGPHAD